MAGGYGGADGHVQFSVLRHNHIFVCNVQSLPEALTEHGLEGERAAKEGNFSVYRTAAGETGNGLVHHGLENGKGNIFMGGPLIQQSLDVCFGKYAAAGGNGINPFRFGSQLSKTGGVHGKKGGHAVDKGTGAAGAGAVHPLVHAVPKIGNLLIFPAQLDDHIGFRMESLHRLRFR